MATGTTSKTYFSKYWYATGPTEIQNSAKALAAGTGRYYNNTTTNYAFTLNGANFEELRSLRDVSITGFKLGINMGRYNSVTPYVNDAKGSFRIISGAHSNSTNYDTSITSDAVVIFSGNVVNAWYYYTEDDLPEVLTWMNNNLSSLLNGYTTGSFAIRGYGKYNQSNGVHLTLDYTYTIPVTGVSLDTNNLSLKTGNTHTLSATVSPNDADNKAVTWSTSNSSVATVSTKGKVTAKGPGTATITATTKDGGYTASCSVSVTQPVTGVSLNTQSLNLNIGSTSTLTATISPSNASNKNVTWSSNANSIATVSNGVVTAVSAGTATITVTTSDGGYTDTCLVTVMTPGIFNIRKGSNEVEKIYIGSTEIKKVYLGNVEIYSNG